MNNNTKKIDYLIIGQGLAGTLLAHFLLKEGKKILIINQEKPNAATKVAAGIINPVTGRRFVKSWRIDELIPFAFTTYAELEKQFNITIYSGVNILRTLFNAQEENDWLARSGEPAYQKYILENAELENYAKLTKQAFSYGELDHAARVDIKLLVATYQLFLQEKGLLSNQVFDYSSLNINPETISYKGVEANKIIFCEGQEATQNPFFKYLPFNGTKGEVLIIRIPNANFKKLLKHRIYIVPINDDLYWVGSSYERAFENAQPTKEGRTFLEERLNEILTVPFEVVEHLSAIRPTVKDRRPFLGLHPQYPHLAIFNGLGTKGTSLGPYWAKHLVDYLLGKIELDQEVDIARISR